MNEGEVREMRRKLDEQYKRDRDTLDRMLDLITRSKSGSGVHVAQGDAVEPLTVPDRVAALILQLDTNFTMQDAWKFIKEKDSEFGAELSRQALSTALWKMKKDGSIKIIIPKKGSSAAIYSKA